MELKHDIKLNLRLDSAGYNTIKARATKRKMNVSEYLRRLIILGLAAEGADSATDSQLRQIQRKLSDAPKHVKDTTVIGDEIEYKPETETQRRVRETLESKGLGGKREPARKGIRFRKDGYPY